MAEVTREASALTGACIAVRRSVFEEVGGFNERLEIAFNDTALCCEALRRGYRNLYVGEISMLHHESKTRGFDDTPEKLARFRHECMLVRTPLIRNFSTTTPITARISASSGNISRRSRARRGSGASIAA